MSGYSNNERRDHINQLIEKMSLRLALPIFLAFWPLDMIYVPEHIWQCLGWRLTAIPICLGSVFAARRATTLAASERVAVIFVTLISLLIYFITYPMRGLSTPYFGGLNLVALAIIPFLPLRRPALLISIFMIYGPFVLIAFFRPGENFELPTFCVHLALMISTIAIALVLRAHTFRLRENERLAEAKLGLLARQVAHDIRSPVSALKIAAETLEGIPEDNRRLIQFAIARIEQIAKDLLQKGKKENDTSDPIEHCHLNPLLEKLTAEKKMQFQDKKNVEVVLEAPDAVYARIDPHEFSRVISNLMNNSLEAIETTGKLLIRASRQGAKIILSIEDNGKGIPSKILAQLGEGKVSYGKRDGNGLGFWHARRSLETWGGTIRIASTEGRGTSVTISLPAA